MRKGVGDGSFQVLDKRIVYLLRAYLRVIIPLTITTIWSDKWSGITKIGDTPTQEKIGRWRSANPSLLFLEIFRKTGMYL